MWDITHQHCPVHPVVPALGLTVLVPASSSAARDGVDGKAGEEVGFSREVPRHGRKLCISVEGERVHTGANVSLIVSLSLSMSPRLASPRLACPRLTWRELPSGLRPVDVLHDDIAEDCPHLALGARAVAPAVAAILWASPAPAPAQQPSSSPSSSPSRRPRCRLLRGPLERRRGCRHGGLLSAMHGTSSTLPCECVERCPCKSLERERLMTHPHHNNPRAIERITCIAAGGASAHVSVLEYKGILAFTEL